jgi:hypothetical protein
LNHIITQTAFLKFIDASSEKKKENGTLSSLQVSKVGGEPLNTMTTHLNKMNKSVSEVVFRKHFYSRFQIGL